MLNPELIKKYGDESASFFNRFISEVGVELAGKCYAVNGKYFTIGSINLPGWIAVCTDSDSYSVIARKCFDICKELSGDGSGDSVGNFVECVIYQQEHAEEDGIKVIVEPVVGEFENEEKLKSAEQFMFAGIDKSLIGETPVNFETSKMYTIAEVAATMCGGYRDYGYDSGSLVSDCARDLAENGRYTPV